MAKQKKGFRHPTGTYNGINYYYGWGGLLTREAGGGFTRDRIKNSPSMQVVRDQNTELGACSIFLKHFKMALAPVLNDLHDGKLHSRFMSLFLKIVKLDDRHEIGKRRASAGLATPLGERALQNFNVTPGIPLYNIFEKGIVYDPETSRFTAAEVNPAAIRFPKGGTQLSLYCGVLEWSADTEELELCHAAPVIIDIDDSKKTFTLEVEGLNRQDGKLQIPVVSVRFFERVKDSYYALNAKNAKGVWFI